MIRIPSSFKLFGITYRVEMVPGPFQVEGDSVNGFVDTDTAVITLRSDLPQDVLMHTFLHELTHCILAAIQHPQWEDEAFVDTFAGLMHQALSTMEGAQ